MQTFEPSDYNCIASIWLRELGFSILYGTLNLKLYKYKFKFYFKLSFYLDL